MKQIVTVTTRQAVNDLAVGCLGALAVAAAVAAAEIALVAFLAAL